MKKQVTSTLVGILCICLTLSTQAQFKSIDSKKDFFKGSTSLTSLRLNKAAIAFVSNDSDKAVEIICTDNSSNKKWAARVEGYLQSAEVLGDNLLIMVSTDFTLFTKSNSTFKAYLINPDKGTIIKEKILFTGNNNYYTLPYVLISKDKKVLTLATRETAIKRNVKIAPGFVGAMYTLKKLSDQGNVIKAFNVLSYDENLVEKNAVSPVLPEGDFIGIQKTINDDIYVAVSQNKKGITISKYLPNTEKAIKSITEPYSYYGGFLNMGHLNESINFYADTINNNTVYISGSFKNGDDYITMFNKYDFASDKHKRFKKSFTKSEVKAMKKSYEPVNKEFKKLKLAEAKDFELAMIAIHENGYFMVLSDHRTTQATTMNSGLFHYSEGIIVYNLDQNLTIKTISTIPRDYLGKTPSSINLCVKDDYLYVFGSHEHHARFMVGKVNIATGKLEDVQSVEPAKANNSNFANLTNAIFSPSRIIMPVLDYKLAFGKIKFDVDLYQFSW